MTEHRKDPNDDDDQERAGFILIAFMAIAFPALLALGFIWSANPVDDENASQQSGGLQSVELTDFDESTESEEPSSVDVAQEEPEPLATNPDVEDSRESAQPNESKDGETAPIVQGSSTENGPAARNLDSGGQLTPGAAPTVSTNPSINASDIAAGIAIDNEPGQTNIVTADGEGVTEIEPAAPVQRSTTTTTTTTRPIQTPNTVEAGTTGVASVRATIPPITSPINVATPTTSPRATIAPPTTTTTTTTEPQVQFESPRTTIAPTTTTTTTTTTTAPVVEPPEFSQRIDIGRIGDTTLAMRFQTTADASYSLIVRSGGSVATTVQGFAQGGQLENVTISGLTPGTDYTVEAVLNTSPPATSPAVPFRTSGGAPEPAEQRVTLINPRVVDLQSTRFEINYESNICANGSFVIRDSAGTIVGSNAGQAAGCTTRHLAIPGFWTPALRPNTTYTITITVEANGAGQGGGNTASTSVSVTTSR